MKDKKQTENEIEIVNVLNFFSRTMPTFPS